MTYVKAQEQIIEDLKKEQKPGEAPASVVSRLCKLAPSSLSEQNISDVVKAWKVLQLMHGTDLDYSGEFIYDTYLFDIDRDGYLRYIGGYDNSIERIPVGCTDTSRLFLEVDLPSNISEIRPANDTWFETCNTDMFFPDDLPRTRKAQKLFDSVGETADSILVWRFQSVEEPLHEHNGRIAPMLKRYKNYHADMLQTSWFWYAFYSFGPENIMPNNLINLLNGIEELDEIFFSWFKFTYYSDDLHLYVIELPLSEIECVEPTDTSNKHRRLFGPSWKQLINFTANTSGYLEVVFPAIRSEWIKGCWDVHVGYRTTIAERSVI